MLYARLLGRDHIEAAGQPAQGTLHVLVQGLGLACLGLLGKQLAETHACLLEGLEHHGPRLLQLNGGKGLGDVLLQEAPREEFHGLLVRSSALQDHEAVLLLLGARHYASYGALRQVLALGRAHDDEHTGLRQALCQLEGIDGVEVVHLHRDVRSGEAVGEDLGEALAVAVVAHPEDGNRRPEVLHGLLAPGPVVFNPLERVLSKHGAVPGSNGVEIHVFGLLQCVDHGAGVGLHGLPRQAAVLRGGGRGQGRPVAEELLRLHAANRAQLWARGPDPPAAATLMSSEDTQCHHQETRCNPGNS
mmetsp:Transcript_22440/g.46540  ORF Transcript_22440/g.46540 Transcript_22440/m.46540 type:complete len:303 (+) Transcript_22440:540-1448(+)